MALSAGVRRFVIATTAWAADEPAVEAALRRASAVAVAAPNFSVGVSLFFRLVDAAVRLYGPIGPSIRMSSSGITPPRPIGRRAPPGSSCAASSRRTPGSAGHGQLDAEGPADPGLVEVAVLRAGRRTRDALVGFDAPGETLELRLTARDRSAYAAGARPLPTG